MTPLVIYKTLSSSGYGTYGHAENQLLVQWLANYGDTGAATAIGELVESWLDGHLGAQLHLVIFSQLPPCGGCQGQFSGDLGQMAIQLRKQYAPEEATEDNPIDPGQIAITLDVFASTYVPGNRNDANGNEDTNDPQGRRNTLYPGTLHYGITDYWNGYVYSEGGDWQATWP